MKAVYFFCCDEERDPVAKGIFEQVMSLYNPHEIELVFDGNPIFEYTDSKGNQFLFVQTKEVLSHNYERYLPELKQFSEYDFAGIVNWHEGKNAPDRVLTVHTNSDVATGNFSPASPILSRNMIQALEKNRKLMVLEDFSTKTEATHWSGVTYHQSPELVTQFAVPLVDVEIGSTAESWGNPIAAQIIAKSLAEVFDRVNEKVISILYIGGEHFDFDLANIAINSEFPFAFSHHLPNQWVRSYINEDEPGVGAQRLQRCKESIIGGVDAVFFHDGMSGPIKDLVRTFAASNHLPLFKYKAFRDPGKLMQDIHVGYNPDQARAVAPSKKEGKKRSQEEGGLTPSSLMFVAPQRTAGLVPAEEAKPAVEAEKSPKGPAL